MSESPRVRYLALARRVRRAVVRAVVVSGRSQALVSRTRSLMREWEPEAAHELRIGQVAAYARAVRDFPGVPELREADPAPIPETLTEFPQIRRAAEFVRSRVPALVEELPDLDEDARQSAITVAGAQSVATVEAVQEAIASDIESGGTLAEFKEKVGDALTSSGLGDAAQEALYRTHVGRAMAAGQIAVLENPAVRSAFPYLEWSATHDSRVRPDHLGMETAGLDGTAVYRADDPVWDWAYPPAAWNCRCVVIPATVEQAAELGVKEARRWLATGRPPEVPQWMKSVPLLVPAGWTPTGRRLSPVG